MPNTKKDKHYTRFGNIYRIIFFLYLPITLG